jgi:hypothetical protein
MGGGPRNDVTMEVDVAGVSTVKSHPQIERGQEAARLGLVPVIPHVKTLDQEDQIKFWAAYYSYLFGVMSASVGPAIARGIVERLPQEQRRKS